MQADVSPDILSESWLDEEIPCGDCGKAARLRSRGHAPVDCTGDVFYKCFACWQLWFAKIAGDLREYGHLWCADCGGKFLTVADFSDYREF